MDLCKTCPTCGTANNPVELLCTRCFGDISGVTPDSPHEGDVTKSTTTVTGEASSLSTLQLLLADGRRIEIRPGETVGRNAAAGELFCEFAATSRNHARFDYSNDVWLITDLNSTNGTWVDGKKLNPDTPVSLENGVEIRFSNSFRAVIRINGKT